MSSLEDSGVSTDAYSTVDLNCNDDADSLKDALEDSRNTTTRTTYNVTGACNSVFIVRNDVKIVGVDSASILAGASQDEPEAVFIDGQSSVRLQDITLGGMLFARNSSSVRFDNVTLPTAVEDGDEYQTNVTIRTAYLRVNSGSVNNLRCTLIATPVSIFAAVLPVVLLKLSPMQTLALLSTAVTSPSPT